MTRSLLPFYDQKPITLDGQMTMKVSFGDKTIVTTVYVKLVAPDRLLLSETVCHLLGIVIYHPNVQSVERCQPEEDHPNVPSVERCQPEEDHPNVPSAERCQPEKDHPNVQSVERCQPEKRNRSDDNGQPVKEELQPSEQPPKLVKQNAGNIVSSTRIRLVSTIRLPANHAAAVPVKIHEISGTAMIELTISWMTVYTLISLW